LREASRAREFAEHMTQQKPVTPMIASANTEVTG
jgi:hypothetical protein